MILATSEDYDYPHIDWECKACGEVYCYAGYPPETRCTSGHGHGWKPTDSQLSEYVDVLDSLEVGDGVVICGEGPAPLMAPVAEVGDGFVVTESIDSPARIVRFGKVTVADDDGEDPYVEWAKDEDEYQTFDDVHHVETVEVMA